MADRITKTQRWLDLIALLLGRRVPLSVEEIMERVPAYAAAWSTGEETKRASARRMFERDKDELRAAGVPLDTVSYSINYGAEAFEGYRITRRDFYLPYLRLIQGEGELGTRETYREVPEVELTASEAALALDALRRVRDLPAFPFAAQAQSAFRKLAFDLDPDQFAEAAIHWVEQPGAAAVLETLGDLSDALLARKRVRFTYHGIHRGQATQREVEPFGLFFQRDWYLVGRDQMRQDIRVFRVRRIESAEVNRQAPETPDYEIPADFELSSYLQRDAWELGSEDAPAQVDVLFHFPASLRAAQRGEGELIEERADGSGVRRFEVHQMDTFARWVLSLAGEAEIVGPPEAVDELRTMANRVAAAYAGGYDGD